MGKASGSGMQGCVECVVGAVYSALEDADEAGVDVTDHDSVCAHLKSKEGDFCSVMGTCLVAPEFCALGTDPENVPCMDELETLDESIAKYALRNIALN